jgi:hypothetical protein
LLKDDQASVGHLADSLGIDRSHPVVEIAGLAAGLADQGVEPAVARRLALANPAKVGDWLDHPERWEKAQNPAGLLVKRLREDPPPVSGRRGRR